MIGIILTVFFGIVAIVALYFQFAVKLSVLPSGPIDILNPFSTPFILRNDSLLWITNIKPYQVIINKINNKSMAVNINLVAPAIFYLAPGESTTFNLPVAELNFPKKINYINIVIGISYCPAFIPFYNKEKHVRFVTIEEKNGNLKWVSKALSE